MDVLFEHALPYFRTSSSDESLTKSHVHQTLLSHTSPLNYAGALIFWAYIFFALYFIWDILRTLIALHKFAAYRGHVYSRPAVAVFGSFALLSFGSLSWHMLNVLIRSFTAWTTTLNTANYSFHPLHIWTWSVSSTQFEDFARAIISSGPRWIWAQADLGTTLVTAYWIGIAGRVGVGSSADAAVTPVPKLWTFFGLLQILPTSLTQSLFMVALLLTPKRSISDRAGKGKAEGDSSDGGAWKKPVILLGKPGYWITSGLIYCFILVEVTQPERKHLLIPLIFIARVLLIAPAVLPFARLTLSSDNEDNDKNDTTTEAKKEASNSSKAKKETQSPKSKSKSKAVSKTDLESKAVSDNDTTSDDSGPSSVSRKTTNEILDKANPFQLVDLPLALLALTTWAVLHQAYWTFQEIGGDEKQAFDRLLSALDEHPAVSALGYDFIISTVVFVAWMVWGRGKQG